MLVELKEESAFNEAIQKPCLSVVHFHAPWAEQCQQVTEVLQVLAEQKNYSEVMFYSCPAEDLSEVSLKYKIEAVPTVVIFRSGKVVEVINGADAPKITDAINRYVLVDSPSKQESNVVKLEDRLKALINRSKVMLFMKGERNAPRCGFSKQIIEILNDLKIQYDTFDILTNEEVRQGLKKYSEWPTYPQLYINGELIGGLDIVKEMTASGDLQSMLNAA
nr:unnamed protein product [Callosobruchus chinensis]